MRLELLVEEGPEQAATEEMSRIAAVLPRHLAAVVDRPLPTNTVNVVVCSGQLMAELNSRFRGKHGVTDVLSFPLADCAEAEVAGEVYICWPRLLEQATELGHSWQREFGFLLVHGLLHLLGYQHGSEPNPEMRLLEEQTLSQLGLRR